MKSDHVIRIKKARLSYNVWSTFQPKTSMVTSQLKINNRQPEPQNSLPDKAPASWRINSATRHYSSMRIPVSPACSATRNNYLNWSFSLSTTKIKP
uniref:Uncharacterized protein n=1 Tax=Arundo donax TaxID=35708 RepID=A0A0A9HB25_ARUDO